MSASASDARSALVSGRPLGNGEELPRRGELLGSQHEGRPRPISYRSTSGWASASESHRPPRYPVDPAVPSLNFDPGTRDPDRNGAGRLPRPPVPGGEGDPHRNHDGETNPNSELGGGYHEQEDHRDSKERGEHAVKNAEPRIDPIGANPPGRPIAAHDPNMDVGPNIEPRSAAIYLRVSTADASTEPAERPESLATARTNYAKPTPP